VAKLSRIQLAAIVAAVVIIVVVVVVVNNYQNENPIETQKIIPEANGQVPVNAMAEITSQIANQLTNVSVAPELQRENIKQAESLIFGKPVILATPSVPDTIAISNDYDVMVTNIKTSLDLCVNGLCSDPLVQAEAKELLDRVTYWQETKENLETQTKDPACDPLNPATCPQLDLGDEPRAAGPGINVGTDKIWDGWYREIRSPYSVNTNYLKAFGPHENVITVGPMSPGECSTVIKEIQGIKSIQRPVKIPIWQEPWTSRAQIIGWQTVWVVDFVPAEFIKSLNYCNSSTGMTFDYTIDVIIERELTHFWKFLPAGIP